MSYKLSAKPSKINAVDIITKAAFQMRERKRFEKAHQEDFTEHSQESQPYIGQNDCMKYEARQLILVFKEQEKLPGYIMVT